MADLRANMKETVQAVIQGYNKWDMDAIMSYRAENCVHRVIPKSLGREPRNNEQYREYFSSMIPQFKDFKVWSEFETYDVENRKAALHVFSTATTGLGPYNNEYAIFLTLNDDCTKVVVFEEMVDSAYSQDFFVRLREHHQKQGQ